MKSYDSDLPKIEEFVRLNGKTLLEVGCGDGRLTGLLAEKAGAITAIDPDHKRIEAARKNIKGIKFWVGKYFPYCAVLKNSAAGHLSNNIRYRSTPPPVMSGTDFKVRFFVRMLHPESARVFRQARDVLLTGCPWFETGFYYPGQINCRRQPHGRAGSSGKT